jgi:hypothetical protein
MIERIKQYFKSKKELIDENGRLHHQIHLMQEHIQFQNETNYKLERKLQVSAEMWDLENLTKKY